MVSLTSANAEGYLDWLKAVHARSHGNADLAAHFFRRSFSLLRSGGNLGLVATNTIAQGDTRSTGLRWICTNGGEIYDATRRLPWPGMAAVIVSVVHIHRGVWPFKRELDGTATSSISAFLSVGSMHEDPARLSANVNQSFKGSFVLGMGFTFDDTDKKGVASPLSEMDRLVKLDPKNEEAIFPYIGGAELNTSPTHAHHRYVINFWDYPLRREPNLRPSWNKAAHRRKKQWWQAGVVPSDYPHPVAEDWPELLEIVRERVLPIRKNQKAKDRRERWWHYGRRTPALSRAIGGLDRVLAISQTGKHASFCFLPNGMVYGHTVIVFPLDSYSAFCTLQSRLHEVWIRRFCATLKTDLRYLPSDCFWTFPFPKKWSSNPRLEEAGREYYEFRAGLMKRYGEGLTKTYNRFHDRYEHAPEIVRLRELHHKMDRAVLNEYGWNWIPTQCDFLPDHESEEEPSAKRFWRFRWPNEVRDQLLGHLIELNAQRKREEERDGEVELVEMMPETKAPQTLTDEEQPEKSPFLIPPPLFATQDD